MGSVLDLGVEQSVDEVDDEIEDDDQDPVEDDDPHHQRVIPIQRTLYEIATAGIITGSVVIEQIFGVPGLGRYFVQGALNRDYTLVMGVVVFYGVLIIVFNFIVDLVYGLLDPKVKY